VISPAASFLFRDSELGGEGIGRRIISNVAGLLNERNFCQLLTNWAHIEGIDWRERVERAFAACGCNAWVLAVHHAEADIYASRWIQHLERTPEAVSHALEEWMRYYERQRITGNSWCVVTMRRATGPRTWFELDELAAGIRSPVGDHLLRCFEARELLDGLGDDALLDLRPRIAPQTRLEQHFTPAPEGWSPREAQLRLTGGLALDLAVDSSVANPLVRCDGNLPLRELLARAAATTGDTLVRNGAAATRHLLAAGFLLPR
jgi:hypothetical protein